MELSILLLGQACLNKIYVCMNVLYLDKFLNILHVNIVRYRLCREEVGGFFSVLGDYTSSNVWPFDSDIDAVTFVLRMILAFVTCKLLYVFTSTKNSGKTQNIIVIGEDEICFGCSHAKCWK